MLRIIVVAFLLTVTGQSCLILPVPFLLEPIKNAFLVTSMTAAADDVSEWTSAIKAGDKGKVEEHLTPLEKLLSEAVDRDDSLWRVVEPLNIIFNQYADDGFKPEPQYVVDIIQGLADRVNDVDAVGPVDQALQWLRSRSTDVVSPISTDGRRSLDLIECKLQQQHDNVQAVGAAVLAMNELIAAHDKGIEVGRLAVVFYQHVGRWSNRDQKQKPLNQLDLQVRLFARDWHKARQ